MHYRQKNLGYISRKNLKNKLKETKFAFLSTENLDPLTIDSELKGKIDNSLLKEIVSIAKICDAGRFGPEADTQLATLKDQAIHLLKKVDKALS